MMLGDFPSALLVPRMVGRRQHALMARRRLAVGSAAQSQESQHCVLGKRLDSVGLGRPISFCQGCKAHIIQPDFSRDQVVEFAAGKTRQRHDDELGLRTRLEVQQ